MNGRMNDHRSGGTRRVTANLPSALLKEACKHTGKGITGTLVEGLELLRRRAAAERLIALGGKLKLEVDLDASRERSRH
jgi:hypothetical protein